MLCAKFSLVPLLTYTGIFMCVCVCVCICAAVQNPCADQNGGCMHECRVDGGRAHCDCKVGYILAEDGKTCEGKFTPVNNSDEAQR